ncbi:CDP-alcohol phosphatidyltransferase [Micromonospora pattaloongensis]|uniref:CDP-alcohol phosphatidyltransferase n=1 Tax=Micromonospora pattaloongensis TaxID=405436 RepID=A0A1H3SKY6_9ACTN|nr:DUF5941 domain-containing protein [Micromonospora pattaloongensis]SDZ38360.1 CDP-alcohol phosphatidyltransferase [Micromonospora pattaloongensis]
MTLAILLTAPAGAAPLHTGDGSPLPTRLADQLRAAGADDVVVTGDLAEVARLARRGEPLLLCGDDLVAHTAVLRHVATSPVGPTVALVLAEPDRGVPVREDRGRITAVGAAAVDEPAGAFGAVLRVGRPDLPALAAAADAAAADGHSAAVAPLDAVLTRLGRSDTTVFVHRVRLLVARRVGNAAELAAAEREVVAVDSDAAELKLSVKERDDFFTTYFVSNWSPRVTRLAARLGLGPSAVTAISVLFAVAAAALFAFGGRPALVVGAVLLYLGFVLDCVDGQLARYTRNFSAFGGWLDTMADRAKEYVVYAGLAVGVERSGLGNGWALAIAAMVLQTVRHMTDAWYGALHDEAARRPRPAAPSGGLGDRLSRASTRVQADTGSVSYWLKRTVVFPIGERWALIALTVALFNPLVSLVAVLVWGGLAFAYTGALRTLRARSMRVAVLPTVDTTTHRDDGPLARLIGAAGRRVPGVARPLPLAVLAVLAAAGLLVDAVVAGPQSRPAVLVVTALVLVLAGLPSRTPHAGPLDWLVPAALRAAEYLVVVAIGLAAGVPPLFTFALLFALALHHYDLTARLEKRAERRPMLAFTLGWDVRLLVLALAVSAELASIELAGIGLASIAVGALAAYLFLVSTVGSIAGWVTAAADARRPSTGAPTGPALAGSTEGAVKG